MPDAGLARSPPAPVSTAGGARGRENGGGSGPGGFCIADRWRRSASLLDHTPNEDYAQLHANPGVPAAGNHSSAAMATTTMTAAVARSMSFAGSGHEAAGAKAAAAAAANVVEVTLVGAAGVGKSSLIRRFMHNTYDDDHHPTIIGTLTIVNHRAVARKSRSHQPPLDYLTWTGVLRGTVRIAVTKPQQKTHQSLYKPQSTTMKILELGGSSVPQLRGNLLRSTAILLCYALDQPRSVGHLRTLYAAVQTAHQHLTRVRGACHTNGLFADMGL